jgi:hypothetical protein
MSACRSYQCNFEYKAGEVYYGTLTYALCEALRETNFVHLHLLMAKTQEKMKDITKRQNPVIETTVR